MLLTSVLTALLLIPGRGAHPRPAGEGLPATDPAEVGMSVERLERISDVVTRGIRAGAYPGASVVVGRQGYAVVEQGFGHLTWSEFAAPVAPDRTIYDLASLTKVVATTSAIMVLYDEGKLKLDDPVQKYIPEFTGGAKSEVTIRLLLEHRSGLPPGRDLWRTAHSPEEAREQVIDTHLYYRPNARFEYSDLGADMLGFVVERISGEPLDRFVSEHVFQPLGMHDTGFRPDPSLKSRIAPTESWSRRGRALQGEVDDDNAYALGGVAGHAGLFSSASDLAIFAQTLLNGGEYDGVRVFSDSAVKLFTTRAPHAGTRALGWDTCKSGGTCGDFMNTSAFGHTGYTGTSLWIDPERQMFVILLTNREYDAKIRRSMKAIADVRADLADAAVLAVQDDPNGPIAMPAAWRTDRQLGWNRAVRTPHRKTAKRSKKPVTRKPTAGRAKAGA